MECSLFLAGLLSLPTAFSPSDTTSSPAAVATITAEAPGHAFVVRANLSLPRGSMRPFQRGPSPLRILAPDGTPLVTQWEQVARTVDRTLVELSAYVPNALNGRQCFPVVVGGNPYHFDHYRAGPLTITHQLDGIVAAVVDAGGKTHRVSLSGPSSDFHRRGPVVTTGYRHVASAVGGFHVWMTLEAHSRQVSMIVNWNAGELPARPDVFFRSLALELPPGWTWTPVLPDPAMDPAGGFLVAPSDHVLPQRMERSFRVIVHPVIAGALVQGEGFGVTGWRDGGYMAQDIRLPDLSHVAIDLQRKRLDDYDRLANVGATVAGEVPVSPLWPAAGVKYGGMTGGFDIDQYPEIPLAASGDRDGLLSLYVEQLRYASRQMGCIYEADGRPIALDDYLDANGSAPWNLFNNRFLGNPAKDAPFRFSLTGPGTGSAPYDPENFEPIDLQHYVRRTKANKALVWLANDPLARLYLRMDAELGRMTFHEGPGGRLQVPTATGLGTEMGRAEAWVADCMAHAWAVSDDAWRQRSVGWFVTFVDALRAAQMPSGLFSARDNGKVAVNPPFGDYTNAFYWVHRANEQIFLVLALRAIEESVGLDTRDLIRGAGLGMWRLAWKPGTDGPLERYPAGPIGGPRYTTRADIPPGLTDTVARDSYHVATLLAHTHEAGQHMFQATLAYTQTSSLDDALTELEGRGVQYIQSWGNLMAVLQDVLGRP